jgi:signal transduction histidine kinase/signal recognition particle receptor subunit beta
MAQWNHAEKTLYAKLVYYGPAFGGKTTNLSTLHRLTDPAGEQRLLSLQTAGDRTLFFDLLPFDLGHILGYQVAMKLYTVPGQVRYDTTRQIVLGGADAVVFVADSTTDRKEQNRWSLQNLRMNLRKLKLDPDKTPVLFQFNKQDKADAAEPGKVAGWLKIDPEAAFPAVATEGHGVLETFVAASHAMLAKIYEQADRRTKKGIDPTQLAQQLEKAFEPYLGRSIDPVAEGDANSTPPHTDQIILEGENLLADAVETQTQLGEQLGDAKARLKRQRQELDALRRLSESTIKVGACFETERVVDAALETAAEILEAGAISLIRRRPLEDPVVERCWGRVQEPLVASQEGAALAERMISAGNSCVVDELLSELTTPAALEPLSGLRAAVCVAMGEESQHYLLAYATQPDGSFNVEDVRFLKTLGAHLEVGLEQIRLHQEVATHRDELEKKVEQRTVALRRAYDQLREMEQTKDRLINNLSHEMRTPLTAILGAATFMHDYRSNAAQRTELTESMLQSAEVLQHHLDQLLRLAELDEASALSLSATTGKDLIDAAVSLCETDRIEVRLPNSNEPLRLDLDRVSRALSNLLDNAVKFSAADAQIQLELECDDAGVSITVSDRGGGVAEEDRERIFAAFEQGGATLTDKPSGMGMGLYEAAVIARQHGGTLEHEARKGGGSRFILRLPEARIDAVDHEREVAHA